MPGHMQGLGFGGLGFYCLHFPSKRLTVQVATEEGCTGPGFEIRSQKVQIRFCQAQCVHVATWYIPGS